MNAPKLFSGYQKFVISVLAFLQFTIILDFMILSPLGAILMRDLHITTSMFGWVVSVYAFSAGASGILAAGFADRFDRKKMLLFFYVGFMAGTLLCGVAKGYEFLLGARIVTGLFGGVIGSISFTIIVDLFPMEVRGRVMGFVGAAFAASQVLGIPIGLYLANRWGWHATFLMIVAVSAIVGVVIFIYLKPIDGHLKLKMDRNPFHHLLATVMRPRYLQGFAATTLLSTGGFMLMPFGSAFSVHNLGIPLEKLPMVYMATGLCAIVSGPLAGRLSDTMGKYKTFCAGTAITLVMVLIYCNRGVTPLGWVILINALMFVGISARMVSAQALMSAVPEPRDRGAYMSINSSVQQISGGIASIVAGLIVVQSAEGPLQHYGILGWVVVCAMLITLFMMYFISKKAIPTPPKPA